VCCWLWCCHCCLCWFWLWQWQWRWRCKGTTRQSSSWSWPNKTQSSETFNSIWQSHFLLYFRLFNLTRFACRRPSVRPQFTCECVYLCEGATPPSPYSCHRLYVCLSGNANGNILASTSLFATDSNMTSFFTLLFFANFLC